MAVGRDYQYVAAPAVSANKARLARLLAAAAWDEQTFTFGQLDQLVGGLPASARESGVAGERG